MTPPGRRAGRGATAAVLVVVAVAAAVLAGGAAVVASVAGPGGAAGLDDVIERVNTEDITRFLEELDRDLVPQMPRFDVMQIIDDPGTLLEPGRVLQAAGSYLAREVVTGLGILGALVTMAVLVAAFDALASGVSARGPVVAAQAVCRVILVIMGVTAFERVAALGIETVENMSSLLYALMPSLVTAMAASGAIVTAAVVSPVMVAATAAMGTLVRSWIIPTLLMAAVLGLVGDVGGRKQVSRIAAVMRQWAMIIMGLASTLFVAATGIRSGIAKVSDAAAGRAAKFLAGSMVPVVGKALSDAIDVVAASSSLVRGALGAFGLAALVMLCLFPLMKMAGIMLAFRVAGGLCQPLGDSRLSDALWEMADALQGLCVAVGVVGLMFFLCMAAFAGLGGVLPR
jgi:stage III sporulation protein AE